MDKLRQTNELLPGWLVGTWEFVHTTAPACYPFSMIYHFDRFGINYWEMPFDDFSKTNIVFKRPYREQSDGYWLLWPTASHFHRCESSFDEVLSVGRDENLWWMRILTTPSPELRYFISPASGELIDLTEHPP